MMKFLIVLSVVGIVANQATAATVAASAVTADATKMVADAAKTATDAVGGAVATGQTVAKDTMGTAMGAVTDPVGTAQGLAGQAKAAIPDMSKMTGMYAPFAKMYRDMTRDNLDAAEVAIVGSMDHLNNGMKTMGESMKSLPLFGGLVSPFWNMGAQLSTMPRGLATTGFGGARSGMNSVFGLMGVTGGSDKNGLRPDISNGGFKMPGLSGLLPSTPPAVAAATTAAAAA